MEQLALRPRTAIATAAVGLLLLTTVVGGKVLYTVLHSAAGGSGAVAEVASGFHLERGRAIYMSSCASCPGTRGQGVPRQGIALADNAFVQRTGHDQFIRFLEVGRMPGDPGSVMNLYMPPRGGNPSLGDDDLAAVSAYVRTLQPTHAAASAR
jgi:cytochrome c